MKLIRSISSNLGLAGLFPIAPQTYMKAWRNRKQQALEAAKAGETHKSS